MEQIFISFALNILLGSAAYIKKSVSKSGFAAGVITGSIILYCGGFLFWIILVAFFVSSTLLSMIKKKRKKESSKIHSKGSRRDYQQVLANSLTATICSILYYFTYDSIFVIAYITAFAASNSDTWASELGVLSRENPRSILTLEHLAPGTSGGVSALGTLASYGGAFFITLVFRITLNFNPIIITALPLITLIIMNMGFMGSVFDSILGASFQAKYKDPFSGTITEKSHVNGTDTELVKGYKWINNDMVNFLSSLASVIFASALYALIK
jgi:uncharacterized protein (TIGR00297 family)